MEVVDRSSSSEGFADLDSRHDADNQRRRSGSRSGMQMDGAKRVCQTNCCASDSGSGEGTAMAVDAASFQAAPFPAGHRLLLLLLRRCCS